MEPLQVMEIARETVWVLLKLSLPTLVVALLVGLAISLLQALTQIQEPTLSFVPKIIAVFITMLLSFSYVGSIMGEYFEHLVSAMIHLE
ncbi:MAG: flagellar biosynthesis protein FliQ [Proteobacteria bacterium]|nr:flagellar biosynthesis protein FliQ [Pseudomonadota bacterium]